MDTLVEIANATSVANSTVASIILETTTLINNLTTAIHNELVQNSTTESTIIPTELTISENRTTGILGLSEIDDNGHKNPELKYFSTVIIIFMGLTILIVPAFCFVGVVCARARVFRTVREVAGRGWGFNDEEVPYAEFGSEDYTKDRPVSSRNRNCDVKVLVADDNRLPSSQSQSSTRRGSFLRYHNNTTTDDEDDIASLPPTFVQIQNSA